MQDELKDLVVCVNDATQYIRLKLNLNLNSQSFLAQG